jgi:hypothetical protein
MKKKTIKIATGTSVKITKTSRALLERAHKDGIIKMYKNVPLSPTATALLASYM